MYQSHYLSRYSPLSTNLSPLSLLQPMFLVVSGLLAALYAWTGSYALVIIILGTGITTLSTPSAASTWRSQVARARLAPELEDLQRRYRTDPRSLAAETRALFKRHGVSPLAGCLPALISAPILLGVYQVVRGLTYRPPGAVNFRPRYLLHSSRLYYSLAASSTMRSWGVNLASSGATALQISMSSAGLFVVLVAITVIAGLYQQHIVRKALPGSGSIGSTKADRLLRLLPAVFAIWGLAVPLAVTLYYASSSLTRLAQQWLLIKLHPF